MKYLNELFLPYDTFLETNILLTSIPSILNIFSVFVFMGVAYFDFLWSKFMLFPLILMHCKEKEDFFFIIILGIRVMIIYFYFVLIDLINDYKNIYSHNNNVCLGKGVIKIFSDL